VVGAEDFDGSSSDGRPGGSCLACLSCHDGPVAINKSISGVLSFNKGAIGNRSCTLTGYGKAPGTSMNY
jgi:hypothetical protein